MVVCFILLVISRYLATRDDKGKPQWMAVGVAAIAFLIWLCWMEKPPFNEWMKDISYLPPLFVLVFTFVVPWIYQGDKIP
jgi:hypothetical protein